ncbi:MAG: hypothetical protein OZ921_17195 [Sorangiineae bacterium]|nr:hypothetical protein [Polyangiaceae bacterium]MEB2324253.1 hypothetical protein [Sorangiineae bacterium]
MRYFVTIDDVERTVDVEELPGGGFDVRLVDESGARQPALDVDVVARGGLLNLRISGQVIDLVVDGAPPTLDVYASGHRATLTVESARMRAAAAVRGARAGGSTTGAVLSPMPGKIVKLLVAEGAEVAVGTPLVVVEAMKMENELSAERAGIVKEVHVAPGDNVDGGARLITIS